jgi:hypothetical protein
MARVLDFKDHRRELDRNRYVYAVVSRRSRGVSIGVNLNPDKVATDHLLPGRSHGSVAGGDRRALLRAS